MTIDEFFETFTNFLILTGGATGEALENAVSENKSVGSAFFKPYKSTSGFFTQASFLVTAPISLAILSLELLVVSMALIPWSIAQACMGNTNKAAEDILGSGVFLLGALVTMLAAIISPLVNLIDLIGSGCVSVEKACQEEEKTAAGSMSI